MAIGDQENDRSMLEAVGNPVVMGNGKEELKKLPNMSQNLMLNLVSRMPLTNGF